MTPVVFIDGAAGTTGLEIRDRLAGRADLSVATLPEERRKDPAARREALNDADFVILCLPDDAAREAVALIDSPSTRIIDASSAHRVADGWTYGFSELEADQADRIAAARLVANPGCYPTGFLALVRPLVRAKLLPTSALLTVNAASGYSGGGKAMIAEFEAPDAPAFRSYAYAGGHKHLPEMRAFSGLTHDPIFAPAVTRAYRGMLVEVPLHLSALPAKPALADLEQLLREAYQGQPIVTVAEPAAVIAIEENAETDRMTLRVCGDAATGQARLVATLDNLGKGAGGAAVQNLNIMAGLPAAAGLIV